MDGRLEGFIADDPRPVIVQNGIQRKIAFLHGPITVMGEEWLERCRGLDTCENRRDTKTFAYLDKKNLNVSLK
jgi:hypothetical protein